MDINILLATLRRSGRMPSAQLLAALEVSRPTLMRAVRAAGEQVLVVGQAKRTSYAARRPLRGSLGPLPVYRIDPNGSPRRVSNLDLAYPHGSVFDLAALGDWPVADDAAGQGGWHEGVPYCLQDMRPDGFLGRAFAREHAAVLQVSADPRAWSEDDALHALSVLGSDQSGDFVVGEGAYQRWQARRVLPFESISDETLPTVYPELALRAMQSGVANSSAAGEFPKFTAVRALGAELAHVIVKFSGNDTSEGSRRWADLLVCEQLGTTLAGTLEGLSAARTTIHRAGDRTFLESVRFDRHGAHGRSPMCSWAALNLELFALSGRPWPDGAARLQAAGLIDVASRDAVSRLWFFGQLIANTDMHDGNLSFIPREQRLAVAPVYDMLPMLYAPRSGVEVASRDFVVRLPRPEEGALWLDAGTAAIALWHQAADDRRISAPFRRICRENAAKVEQARQVVAQW